MELYDYQKDAVKRMKSGSILCGSVGSGKSLTALSYYYILEGGSLDDMSVLMNNPRDLYIITTARKRDTFEWDKELVPFLMSKDNNQYGNKVVIDSWNNISKYTSITNAFFIFDEQRVVGSGSWVKAFLKITKVNEWILLSATPGDSWIDYIPVFVANGFYKNRTEFIRRHVIYNSYSKFPKIDRYIDQGKLTRYRNSILVNMDYHKKSNNHHEQIIAEYDKETYKKVMKERWNIFTNSPIANISEFCHVLRRVVNEDKSRLEAVREIVEKKRKVIVFYNFNYELDLLKSIQCDNNPTIAEWNGFVHEPIPKKDDWIYLVQYSAGAEGWNCIETDTIIFYSQNYSYKITTQSSGRIDRLNTPFSDLYYYHIRSNSGIDVSIYKALKNKKKFNEQQFKVENNLA